MKNNKVIIGLFMVSVLSGISFTAKADDTISSSVALEKNGNVNLVIPSEADKVIVDSDNQIKYQINDAVTLKGNNGEDLVAPVVVDTQVDSSEEGDTTGKTTYTTDLREAEAVDDDSSNEFNLGTAVLGNLFGTKAYAAVSLDNKSTANGWEKTGGVKFKLTVHWQIIDDYYVKIADVSGGYTNYDNSIMVVGGSVTTKMGLYPQSITKNVGSSRSWSFSTGFSKIPKAGNRESTTYTATLKHGSSKWTYKLYNQPF